MCFRADPRGRDPKAEGGARLFRLLPDQQRLVADQRHSGRTLLVHASTGQDSHPDRPRDEPDVLAKFMAATILRPITSAVRDYFCKYKNEPTERKFVAASAEHAARMFRRSTLGDSSEKEILVMTAQMKDANADPYVYLLTDTGKSRYMRPAA
jgi:hypothetical protein